MTIFMQPILQEFSDLIRVLVYEIHSYIKTTG